MGFHTFDPDRVDALEDPGRYQYLSVDELLALLSPAGTVADLGSGTGFYTDHVAPYVDRLYAVDVQPAMHALHREKGLPDAVTPVVADAADLPFRDDLLDRIFSTMTYHEFANDAALAELARVCAPGGLVVTADWSREGECAAGPPREERHALADARVALEAEGFTIERGRERRETFVCAARRDENERT